MPLSTVNKLQSLRRAGLALALLVTALAPAPALGQDGPRRSLQDLLAEQRAKADALRATLAPEVEQRLAKLQAAVNARSNLGAEVAAIETLRAELVAFGPTISPLLLTAINPPDKSDATREELAGEVVLVLQSMPLTVVLDELCTMALEGNRIGRRSALDLLGYVERRDRALPVLLTAYAEDAESRTAALRSICLLGGPEAEVLLEELLEGATAIGEAKQEPVALLSSALLTMVEQAQGGMPLRTGQLGFLERVVHSRALDNLVLPALALCQVAPEGSLAEADTIAFAKLTQRGTMPRPLRLAILQGMPSSALPFSNALADELQSLVDGSSPELAEGALICLTRYGDRKAKTQLLKPYRDAVSEDRNDPAALEARGQILMRIGEYHDATVDLKRAIRIIENDDERSPFMANSAYETLARTYCRMGEYKKAYDALEDSKLATNQRRKLAQEADFAPLVEDEDFREAFRL